MIWCFCIDLVSSLTFNPECDRHIYITISIYYYLNHIYLMFQKQLKRKKKEKTG